MYGRNYYRPDQYVSKSVMEKRALPYIQGELLRLHTSNAQMLTDESELEFLKVAKQVTFDRENNIQWYESTVQLPLVSNEVQLPLSICPFRCVSSCLNTACCSTV